MSDPANRLRKITAIMLGSAALVLLIWDIWVANNEVANDTISEILRDLSHRFYSLPFILMIVMGHLFWNQPIEARASKEVRIKTFWIYAAGPSAVVILRDVVNLFVQLPTFAYANLVLAAAGFLVGAKFWPQAMPSDAPPSA